MGSVLGALPVVGSLTGNSNAGILGNVLGTPNTAAQNVNQVNPQVAQLQAQQLQQANNYNANLGNTTKDQINSATDSSRLQTQQQIQQSNANSNARGMLYGGYSQNSANNVAANNAGSLNNQIAQINYGAQQTGQQMNQSAINNGLISQSLNQQYNNNLYNAALAQQQNNAGAFNAMFTPGMQSGGSGSGAVGGLIASM